MKIRSITYFLHPGWPLRDETLERAGRFIAAARPAYEAAGYEVQTTRLATIPFPYLVPSLEAGGVVELAQTLASLGGELGYDYVALGPALAHEPASYERVPEVIAATENVFVAGMMTTPGGGVSLPAVRACADIIHRVARQSDDGFSNLRFGALANVPPGGPFLPGAYLDPKATNAASFALATEGADLAVTAVSRAGSLEEARRRVIQAVEENARVLAGVAQQLVEAPEPGDNLQFGGIDFTLAPFPREEISFGTAMEGLGVPAVGLHGSLAAAAFLTDSLDRAEYPRAGFNGLMLPVLEDSALAKRAAEGTLTLMDLLMYSAVCGTGLDTLPLPGDTSREQLAAILLDVAALAQRLDKPLIARLMPVPGKAAGDPTGFDFPYFANSRVLEVRAAPLERLFSQSEEFSIGKKRQNARYEN